MAASMGMQTVGVGGGVAGPMCRAIGQADPVPPSLGQERVFPPGGVGSSRDALGLGCRGLSCQLVFFLGAGVQVCMCAETLDLLGVLLSSPLYRPACWATWPHHMRRPETKSLKVGGQSVISGPHTLVPPCMYQPLRPFLSAVD